MKHFLFIAFAGCPAPSSGDLTPHECEECDLVRQAFSGHTPWSLPRATIHEHFGDLPLLSPAAFRYFLPAYLHLALHCEPGTLDEEVRQFSIYSLLPSTTSDSAWFEARFRAFTPSELAALVQALEVFATDPRHEYDRDEAREALTFWRDALARSTPVGA